MKKLITLLFTLLVVSIYAKTCAVIVGVEKYHDASMNLNASVDDAQKMYAFLKKDKRNKVVLLKDYQATKQNIMYAMQKVYALATPKDKIVFYFSGHGSTGLFCPTNITPTGRNALWHTEIRAYFKKSKAKYKMVIADACLSGSIVGTSQANNATSTSPSKENIIFFMSSRKNENSIEDRRLNAGYFTNFFVKGMKGAADRNRDRKITLIELYAYVRKSVRRYSQYKQTPIIYGRFNKRSVIGTY